MTTVRDYLRHMRTLGQPAEPQRAPVAEPNSAPRSITDADRRLSDVVSPGRPLRIQSRLLGDVIAIVDDQDSDAGTDAYTRSEFVTAMRIARDPEMFQQLHGIRCALGPFDVIDGSSGQVNR